MGGKKKVAAAPRLQNAVSHQYPWAKGDTRQEREAAWLLSNEAFHFGHPRTVACKATRLDSDSWIDLTKKTKQNWNGQRS